MTTAEIRKAFLDYFAQRGHTVVSSSSLIPAGDPTLLFVNAGMVQFKDCFLGSDKRSYTRAVTCQKCLRISGKHNDLENVGRTARHHTFFEMLGNFSFGDYFKAEAIQYGWEFLTATLGLPKERLWVTVYEEDDEAAELWRTLTDVRPERILRCGKEDNFWAMGDTGPCGPCSEIHFYLGSDLSQQTEAEFRRGDGAFVEIWNLVFMQFNRDIAGTLTPLPKPSVDTGMGLERVAAVKQEVLSNYDTDLLRQLIAFTEKLSGTHYDGRDYRERDLDSDRQYAADVALRVIADHIRACSFLVADGVSPSSDGRGYVLRRLIRRACRHGRTLGFEKPFLCSVSQEFVHLMAGAYPELTANAEKIERLIRAEEEKFLATLDAGLGLLQREVADVKKGASRILPGAVAFLLHDTYGFPLDLTQDIVRHHGLTVDEHAFQERMEEQRERSRNARASDAGLLLRKTVKPIPSKFVGYDYPEYESRVVALFSREGEIKRAREGDEVALIAEITPFYAESGGQLGDTGWISSNDASLTVLDTQKIGGESIVHICQVSEGEITSGTPVRLAIDDERRRKMRINHSSTHLLHLALRDVLGDHVRQAGSRVSETSLRFDFTHFEAPTAAQLEEIEARVNEQVRGNHDVVTRELPLEEAKRLGAMALFDEKYGARVRVIEVCPRSRELCGGTHVRRSGDIGFFTILSEGAIASGVRRIEASGGEPAILGYAEQKRVIRDLVSLLRTGEKDLGDRMRKLLDRNRELEKKLEQMLVGHQQTQAGDLVEAASVTSQGVKVVTRIVEHGNPKRLREMADDLKVRLQSGCFALGSVVDGKAILLTGVTADLTSRYHAGRLLEEISQVMGSRGGGRPDLAQAGGGDPEKLPLALERFRELLS